MKELSIMQMEEIEGGSRLSDCISASIWGIGAIAGGILGGPAGLGVGWYAASRGADYLGACTGWW